MKKAIAIVIAITFIVTSCSVSKTKSETTTTDKPSHNSKLSFVQCGLIDCATLKVPMNYKKPNGRKISIAIAKIPAKNQKTKKGVLLVNPGGPGASGISFLRDAAGYIFPDTILNQFDIIGWDPRGVGNSTKVTCSASLDPLFSGVDYSPDNQKEYDDLIKANKWFGEQCAKQDKELLPFLSTVNSVRDMDSIRKALGEKKINYLGFSYGTVLGQVYATYYPKNFRTMVIDGVVDLELDPVKTSLEQVVGFEDSLNSFFDYCRTKPCRFSGSQDPLTVYKNIASQVDSKPVVSKSDPTLTLGPAQLDVGVPYFLYSGEIGWDSLDAALVSLSQGDPDALLSGFESYVGRSKGGKYDGEYASFLSIGCADGNIGTAQDLKSMSEKIVSKAPVLGVSSVYLGLPCSLWPINTKSETFKVNNKGSATIVVIGTTGDPATPVQWARSAAKELSNSVYVERRGEGHTAYGQGNECIDNLVDKFIVSAKAPNSKVC